METDKDHIHYLMEFPPTLSVSNLVRTLKAYTAYHIWRSAFTEALSRYFGKSAHSGLTAILSVQLAMCRRKP